MKAGFAVLLLSEIFFSNSAHAGIDLAHPPVVCMEDVVKDPALIQQIYSSADDNDMPPSVLFGALMQESRLMTSLTIHPDSGQYSCGIAQIGLSEWCSWARSSDPNEQNAIDWPKNLISDFQRKHPSVDDFCDGDFLASEFVGPLYDQAEGRMATWSIENPTQAQNFYECIDQIKDEPSLDLLTQPIPYKKIQGAYGKILDRLKQDPDFKAARYPDDDSTQRLRYALVKSFVNHCSDFHYAIPAMAKALKDVYDSLPAEMRNAQRYSANEKKSPSCPHTAKTDAYPLQAAWLLSDAIYNAGPSILNGVLQCRIAHSISWQDFGPQGLSDCIVEAASQDSNIQGSAKHHIRLVVNHVTAPGQTIIK